jgi:hypothetical protein
MAWPGRVLPRENWPPVLFLVGSGYTARCGCVRSTDIRRPESGVQIHVIPSHFLLHAHTRRVPWIARTSELCCPHYLRRCTSSAWPAAQWVLQCLVPCMVPSQIARKSGKLEPKAPISYINILTRARRIVPVSRRTRVESFGALFRHPKLIFKNKLHNIFPFFFLPNWFRTVDSAGVSSYTYIGLSLLDSTYYRTSALFWNRNT